MSEGMLGRLPLSAVRGPKAALDDRLAGSDGEEWLDALKKFLRRENPWVKAQVKVSTPSPVEVVRWRKLSDTAIEVNLDAPPILPFDNAQIEWQPPAGRGWVKVERIGEEVFVGGRKVIFHLEPEQLEGTIMGHELRRRLQTKDVLDPRIIDALTEFESGRLIPDSWKQDSRGRTLYLFAWAVGFRARDVLQCVRGLYWLGGRWQRNYIWLACGWDVQYPTLLLAS